MSIYGMIVPHSGFCTDRMGKVINLFGEDKFWLSFYDVRPSKLFDGADQRLAIFIAKFNHNDGLNYTSKYYRWNPISRSYLFKNLKYVQYLNNSPIENSIPKINTK